MNVVLVDGFLFCSRDQEVTGLFHKFRRIYSCDLICLGVVGKSSILKHVVSDIVDIKTFSIIYSRVVLNNTNDFTSVF